MELFDARRWLREHAVASRHDPGAVQRLQDELNPEVQKLWAWLDTLRPIDAQSFVFAALEGLAGPLIHARAQKNLKGREAAEWQAQHSAVVRNVLASRQRGEQTDYLRAFIGALENLSFPLDTLGTQAAIVRAANVVLDRHDISPALVSKILKVIR